MKNHYYLIQIGHMIAQIMDAWKSLWEGIRQSKEQKHRRILESGKPSGFRNAIWKRLPVFKSGWNKRLYGKGAIISGNFPALFRRRP
ncbi:MAG: hypothetical protein IJK52_13305 [Oscillospiraceae bacterium]|nr:hypothetical protein [Oscillospiraceae bacterium]